MMSSVCVIRLRCEHDVECVRDSLETCFFNVGADDDRQAASRYQLTGGREHMRERHGRAGWAGVLQLADWCNRLQTASHAGAAWGGGVGGSMKCG